MSYSIQEVSTPNARLVYCESHGYSFNWQTLEGKLEQFVTTSPKLSWAKDKTYIYFFLPPKDPHFLNQVTWVAKEVVGPLNLDNKDEIKTQDLDRGIAYQLQTKLEKFTDFFPQRLEELHQILVEKLEASEFELAPTWRVAIGRDGSLAVEVFLA